jgi:hypothetical protein
MMIMLILRPVDVNQDLTRRSSARTVGRHVIVATSSAATCWTKCGAAGPPRA